MPASITVLDGGRVLTFVYEDLLRYHGGGSPGGVAIAFKVLERGLPLLGDGDPVDRRSVRIETAFGGPGARDGFECVLRAVTGERYVVDPLLARPRRGRALERFVFALILGDRIASLALRKGFVTEEFIDLARTDERSPAQEERLTVLKDELATRVMAAPAEALFDL